MVCTFARGNRIEQFPDFLPQDIEVAFGGLAEPRLEFGKELFYGIQIRRVRGQNEDDGSGRGDRFHNSRHLVTAEVVEDHGVSRLQRGAQELTHLSQKHLVVHRSVGDHGGGQSPAAQSAHKGRRLPMPVRCRVEAAPTLGRTSVATRHAGRCPRFIDKHELFDFHRGQRLPPRASRPLHVFALLLAGVQGFF